MGQQWTGTAGAGATRNFRTLWPAAASTDSCSSESSLLGHAVACCSYWRLLRREPGHVQKRERGGGGGWEKHLNLKSFGKLRQIPEVIMNNDAKPLWQSHNSKKNQRDHATEGRIK